MKSIVFDSGPIISLAMNNLLKILDPLKIKYGGEFIIPIAVKNEIIDRPEETKIFEFEALQVEGLIRKGTLKIVYNNEINSLADHLMDLCNNSFIAQGNPIKIVQQGEMQALATAIYFNSDTMVVDERITRMMLENPKIIAEIMRNKLHTNIKMNNNSVENFIMHTKKVKVIRSVELVTMAFELGLLNDFIPDKPNGKRILLDSVLWGGKLKGCSVSSGEIERILKLEKV